ncbi:hypothetical protein QBC40DRAFT_296927 [Triangularia verruculosa]|uniref:Uncharacterized protein n=1 Tax=Triangularia verruculosa TaxID=2587418 RepID=A0AAN6XIE7_9PEZI|nr:hypothetical protein QBC40DRAFT_296927 [Triangularia verruculosa]
MARPRTSRPAHSLTFLSALIKCLSLSHRHQRWQAHMMKRPATTEANPSRAAALLHLRPAGLSCRVMVLDARQAERQAGFLQPAVGGKKVRALFGPYDCREGEQRDLSAHHHVDGVTGARIIPAASIGSGWLAAILLVRPQLLPFNGQAVFEAFIGPPKKTKKRFLDSFSGPGERRRIVTEAAWFDLAPANALPRILCSSLQKPSWRFDNKGLQRKPPLSGPVRSRGVSPRGEWRFGERPPDNHIERSLRPSYHPPKVSRVTTDCFFNQKVTSTCVPRCHGRVAAIILQGPHRSRSGMVRSRAI